MNDPEVRESAFQSSAIPLDEHCAWFQAKRANPNCYIYVVTDREGSPLGQVRFDIQSDGTAEVDVSIAREHRGKGYGTEALRLSTQLFLKESRSERVVGNIKAHNLASLRAFEKAGFVREAKVRVKANEVFRMVWSTRHRPISSDDD
ncbi:MAG: GNAT family N-acetyltransferase [Chloroflexi bacterium]|nr:GNAT family N-acetyltransferase [Chloroflexota bacterium]